VSLLFCRHCKPRTLGSPDTSAAFFLPENEIERLSEWVAEHTLAGAKVRSELSVVPQNMVEKWLTQIETYRHKIRDWRVAIKEVRHWQACRGVLVILVQDMHAGCANGVCAVQAEQTTQILKHTQEEVSCNPANPRACMMPSRAHPTRLPDWVGLV
jgi:hypothetical protein